MRPVTTDRGLLVAALVGLGGVVTTAIVKLLANWFKTRWGAFVSRRIETRSCIVEAIRSLDALDLIGKTLIPSADIVGVLDYFLLTCSGGVEPSPRASSVSSSILQCVTELDTVLLELLKRVRRRSLERRLLACERCLQWVRFRYVEQDEQPFHADGGISADESSRLHDAEELVLLAGDLSKHGAYRRFS